MLHTVSSQLRGFDSILTQCCSLMFAQLFKQLKLENSSTIIRPENKYFSQLARGVDKLIRLVNIIFGTTSPLRLIASA